MTVGALTGTLSGVGQVVGCVNRQSNGIMVELDPTVPDWAKQPEPPITEIPMTAADVLEICV